MRKGVIDWAKPAYGTYARRLGKHDGTAPRILCDLCTKPVKVGDRWAAGPRAKKGVHAECRERLLAAQGA